jgi:hypothetical protein
MTGAWGDDTVDLDRDDLEPAIDWQQRGRFECEHCGRVLTTLGGMKCHVEAVHSVTAVELRSKLKAEASALAKAKQDAGAAETKRLADRDSRKVTLTTAEVDGITAEMESLIDMMEPYWSQGSAHKDARAIIDRLNALADGFLSPSSPPTE